MQTLEQFSIGARLSRGRSYARRGQVLSIDIRNGSVEAQVQGSRERSYDVGISVRTIEAADWERLRQALAEQPVIAASLPAGRMPENIEDTFKAVGLSMFPERGDDLETDCSCPDWSNPCKHIAAVYLLLGEEFDRDPFLIFRMRGMDREDLLGEEFRQSAQTIEGPPLAPEALPEDPDDFWANPLPALASVDLGTATVPDLHAALPKQLGRFPFWQGVQELIPALRDIYENASQSALDVYLGQGLAATPNLIGAENSTKPSKSSGEIPLLSMAPLEFSSATTWATVISSHLTALGVQHESSRIWSGVGEGRGMG